MARFFSNPGAAWDGPRGNFPLSPPSLGNLWKIFGLGGQFVVKSTYFLR